MFLALWEYEVKPGSEKDYEKVYGPEGDWARLFRRDRRYRGTRLLRDMERERVYVTLDYWESREAYEEFLKERKEEYDAIEKIGEALTRTERRMGWFEDAS
jgi:heme-degrading monooxygenase HmoA